MSEESLESASQINDTEMNHRYETSPAIEKNEHLELDDASEDMDESTMSLPLSKIKRIFKMDPEYFGSSASAVYATGTATELFIQYLVEHASMLAKMEKRKKIQYKDLSNAVSSQDALHFLSDTIPKTQTVELALRQKKINLSESDKARYSDAIVNNDTNEKEDVSPVRDSAPTLPKGQRILPFELIPQRTVKKAIIHDIVLNDNFEQPADLMVLDE